MKLSNKLKVVFLKDIKPYKHNIKVHTSEQIEKIKKSIEGNEYIQPICTDKNNCIVIGHGRYYALKEMDPGMEVEVVDLSEYSEDKIKKLRIIDNKLNESDWDFKELETELKDIYDNFDSQLKDIMDDVGFDKTFIDNMVMENDIEERNEMRKDIPDVDIIGEINNKGDYLVIEFDTKEKCNEVKNKLGMQPNHRVINWEVLNKSIKI